MAKHLIDTDLYIDLIRSGQTLGIIRELYDREAAGVYFSSVVAQELLAGVRSAAGRRLVEALVAPFETARRIVTPGHRQWKEAGDLIGRVLSSRPDLRSKLSGLANDCLLALSARSLGATLYTRNRDDFVLLKKMRPFSLVVVS